MAAIDKFYSVVCSDEHGLPACGCRLTNVEKVLLL